MAYEPALMINVWLRRGLVLAWSQLSAIRLLLVPIGVGVGIGIGIVPTVSCAFRYRISQVRIFRKRIQQVRRAIPVGGAAGSLTQGSRSVVPIVGSAGAAAINSSKAGQPSRWHNSTNTPWVSLGCKKAILAPPAPLRGFSSIRRIPLAFNSASASSMFSTRKAIC
jgi:hypothetical protein